MIHVIINAQAVNIIDMPVVFSLLGNSFIVDCSYMCVCQNVSDGFASSKV